MIECLYHSVCIEKACWCRLADHTVVDKNIYESMREEVNKELAEIKEQHVDEEWPE